MLVIIDVKRSIGSSQIATESGRESRRVFGNEVIRQVMDREILEEQAFGQRPEVAFQSLDDFQDLKRIDPQFAECRIRIEIRAQRGGRLRDDGFQIGLGQVHQELFIHHFDHLASNGRLRADDLTSVEILEFS
ncbi:MAG TPA: hypothetical protein VF432_31195 [Thermoanaerobaculia bacterium]